MDEIKGYLRPNELIDILGGISIHGVYKVIKSHNIEVEKENPRKKVIPPQGIRTLLESKGFKYPNINISFQIVKGGVGKTSLSYSLGMRASHYGANILLIDLDQQGNLTRSFKLNARDNPVWINIIRDNIPIEDSIIKLSETLHLLPSNLNNSRLDTELTQSTANLKDIIRDKLNSIRSNYDLVIFDCPPAINKINAAATCASDMVIIPLNPDPYAMDGLEFTLSELSRIKKDFKLDFCYRIVWNRYDARERLGAVYMHDIVKDEKKFRNVLPVVIRVDSSLKNSIFDSRSIFNLPKSSTIREDIDQFTKEVIGLNTWIESTVKKSQTIS
jgi:chromosome partitioning protein